MIRLESPLRCSPEGVQGPDSALCRSSQWSLFFKKAPGANGRSFERNTNTPIVMTKDWSCPVTHTWEPTLNHINLTDIKIPKLGHVYILVEKKVTNETNWVFFSEGHKCIFAVVLQTTSKWSSDSSLGAFCSFHHICTCLRGCIWIYYQIRNKSSFIWIKPIRILWNSALLTCFSEVYHLF